MLQGSARVRRAHGVPALQRARTRGTVLAASAPTISARDSLAADRLVRERRAQEIEKPGQRGENKDTFKRASDGLAELEEAADRPACGRSGAHELRAHENGDADQGRRIGPIDRRGLRQSAVSSKCSRSARGYTKAPCGASRRPAPARAIAFQKRV